MYFVFIMLFSYFILCEFKFEKIVTKTLNNQTNETTFEISEPADISWVEYLLIFWVFTFYCRLISSVRKIMIISYFILIYENYVYEII